MATDAMEPLLNGEGSSSEAVAPAAVDMNPGSPSKYDKPDETEAEILEKKLKKQTDTGVGSKIAASVKKAREGATKATAAAAQVTVVNVDASTPPLSASPSELEIHGGSLSERREAKNLRERMNCLLCTAQVLFTVLCAAAALWLWQDDSFGTGRFIAGCPLDCWLIAFAAIWPCLAVGSLLAVLALKVAEVAYGHVEHVHYAIIGLQGTLGKFVAAVAMYGITKALMHASPEPPGASKGGFDYTPSNFALCALIFTTISLTTKLVCRLLSMRVQAESLFIKLKETVKKEAVLSRLMEEPGPEHVRPHLPNIIALAKLRDIPATAVAAYLHDLHAASLSASRRDRRASFADQMLRLTKSFEKMGEDELEDYAHYAAEYLWVTGRLDLDVQKLTLADFKRILKRPGDAEFAYQLFDLDGDGYVIETEVHERFEEIYRDRRNIANTLVDTNVVIHTLESLMGGIMHVLAFFMYLAIFRVKIGHLVTALSGSAVAFAFVFGNSLREVYESIVWLFIVNPYEAGDCLLYDGGFAAVHKFGLLNTQLMMATGEHLWVPNQKLMKSGVTNLSKSKAVAVFMEMQVDATIKVETVKILNERIKAAVSRNAKLFDQAHSPKAFINGIKSPLKYQIEIEYKHSVPMIQWATYCEGSAVISQVVGEWLQEFDVKFSAPLQQGFAAAQ